MANTLSNVNKILPASINDLGFYSRQIQVLKHVSFTLEPGSKTVLLGPNGAGKSVLLRLLHGLLLPSQGSVTWSQDLAAVRRLQAMVFQRPVMLRRTVLENIEFVLGAVATNSEKRDQALAVLAQSGLKHLADRPARLCSGGEQQRIALARAWALKPELLFLDEPTASLDPAATKAIEQAILEMHAQGTSIVMTTHDLGQARRIADRILFLNQGRLVEDTPAKEFFLKPQSAHAKSYLNGDLLC